MSSPSRWPVRLGWLLVVGSIAISAAAATGTARESQLVAASLYVILAFAAGIGLIIGAWRGGAWKGSARDAWANGLIVGALCAAAAAYGRYYYLEHFFYR